MRTLNSAKNLASSLGLTLLMIIMGFITRKVFVDSIGVEYLGLNGLLSNILGVMSLLEGGFATSVVYNLYRPLAEDDRPRIIALLQLYRKVYRYIALGLFVFSIALFPFIGYLIKDADGISYISVVYFIFVFNTLVQYFTAYKWSIINSSQQNYKLTGLNAVYQLTLSIGKIVILFYTKDYILYLVVEAIVGVLYNIMVVRKANKLFPYIVTKKVYKVEPAVKRNIISNMKALFFHSVGAYFMFSTDNIIVSAFIGVTVIGLWSNYTLITGVVGTFVMQILNSFSESVGNLIASSESDKVYAVFKTVFFVNFVVVSVPVILLWMTLSPFISLWLGPQYQLGHAVVAIVLLNFYIGYMRESIKTFKIKAGIFRPDRFCAFFQGVINLVLSLFLVHFYDLAGVLAATGISMLLVNCWVWPYLCYTRVFKRPVINYFLHYGLYTMVGFISLTCCMLCCSIFKFDNLLFDVVFRGIVSLLIVIAVYFVAFRRTTVFVELKSYCLMIWQSFMVRIRGVKRYG